MTDMSSSGSAPSPVVCPLAKLGRLSPSNVRLPYGSSPIANRRFKLTSSESLDYKSTPPPPQSDYICCANRNTYSLRYADPPSYNQHQQPTTVFYAADDDSGGGEKDDFFRTTLTSVQDRGSPYLDQGYHTLMPAVNPAAWPMPITTPVVATSKYTKRSPSSKYSYFDRLPDDVILHIFSWLGTNELCSSSRVCRRWYNLAWDPSLWSTIILHGERICADKAIKSILRRLCGQGQNGSCPGVKQLFIYDGAKITDKGLTSLSRRCPELTHVQLQNCPTLTDSSISELVTRCPCIQRLDLTGCSLVSCIDIILGPELPQKLLIQYLDVTDCISIHDSSLRIILRNCPQLMYLYLRRCSRITDAVVKFVPFYCSSLRELSVSDCHLITDFALYELAKLGSNLRYLSVAKCGQVSDAGLKVIAKRCYKLRYLNVRGCEAVSDDALAAVARSCPRLRALDIGKCDVSDAGLKILAESCPNLKKLSLRNCDLVTDRGLQFVCYYCRGLQQLNIQDCQISLEGYKAVKRFCKRCIIEHTNPAFF